MPDKNVTILRLTYKKNLVVQNEFDKKLVKERGFLYYFVANYRLLKCVQKKWLISVWLTPPLEI